MRILIVDDDADIRRVARLSLTRLGGMEVEEAASGAEALELARRQPPDAILLDVMMPGSDGPAVLAALRADAKTSHIPVLFLTAKAMTAEVERLRGFGCAAVLTKPFDPTTLADEVLRALRKDDL